METNHSNDIFALAEQFVNYTFQSVFLTGKAGTGKTTFLRHLVKSTPKTVIVAAPTGVAAINAGGVTLHSLLQLSFEPFIPNGVEKQETRFFSKSKKELLRNLDLLIIDEVSMLRADTLDAIDATLKRVRRNNTPFGGVQMLYIGDMFQLPPVAKNEIWNILREYYKSPFFFHAKVLENNPPLYLELKTVFRQQNQNFIELLNRVRTNEVTCDDIESLNARYIKDFTPKKNTHYVTLTTHNHQADAINSSELKGLSTKSFVFSGKIEGEFPEHALPTDMKLELKEGVQIMFIKNDMGENRRYHNGKIARISSINKDRIIALLADTDIEVEVPKETWRNYRYTLNKELGEIQEEILGTFTQYPIRLAWAITVHKSQGLTFDKVQLDISKAFAAGQAYVALSRCKSFEGIVLQKPIDRACVQTDEYALQLAKSELPKLKIEEILLQKKQQFFSQKLLQHFDWKTIRMIIYDFDALLSDKTSEDFEPAHALLAQLKCLLKEQEEILRKFLPQLQILAFDYENSNDLKPLAERCQKAVKYFFDDLILRMLEPLRHNINQFMGAKKAKQYYKNLQEIEANLVLFLQNFKCVKYNQTPLVNADELKIPPRPNVLESAFEKSPKKVKGQTIQETLTLHKEGLSAEKIAKKRSLAKSTICSHLEKLVGEGKIAIHELLSEEKIERILPLVKDIVQGNTKTTSVLEQLGEDYSFHDIRLLTQHYVYSQIISE
ncbi:MAG: helix-turn-helix domain-containing protein [Bacteroidales bacterium]